ncbi:MAG: GH92 family glycosyl hydrolase [Lysobacterales bacterium]|jgi:predicted alpha-1,2-mannosidase
MRHFVTLSRDFLILLLCLAGSALADEPVDLVWPWLDSANSRWFFFNTATRPFGMVNLSPDTEVDGAWGSGYRYDTTEVKALSHVHAWQLSALPVLPVSSRDGLASLLADHYSPFSHDDEVVGPGYHRLKLDRYGIEVELTATTRVGFHRYRYRADAPRQVLLSLAGMLGPAEIGQAEIRQNGPRELEGSMVNSPTRRRPKATPVFFVIRYSADIERLELEKEQDGSLRAALLHIVPGNDALLMKAAISYVDVDGARSNLETELPHWDFDRAVTESREIWNDWLGRIRVEGGTREQRVRFYTDLYHALQGRRIISDADGRYADQTGAQRVIRQLPRKENGQPRYNHHNSDSFWGAQWTIQTLWPLAYPAVASDFANSLMTYYRDGGLVPRGPSGGNYTYVMTGASSTPFLVSNWMKGIRDIDIDEVYQALRKNHVPGGIMARAGYEHDTARGGGLGYYIDKGYVPYPLPEQVRAFHLDGAGQTLEYAYQDWALAQLALRLGHDEDTDYFARRGQNYRNLYDARTGFMRPRLENGDWHTPFDARDYRKGFVESNAAQMTWFVPHDYDGLAELMGGAEVLVQRLDQAFTEAQKQGFTSGKSHDQEVVKQNRRIPINYGNQPSMQTAFIFNVAGAPWLTQKWSREVVDAVYSKVSPYDGYNGDEDQGLMGSLAVLMKIGLFQVDGGVTADPVYQIGSPVFDRVTIELDSVHYPGRSFVIETRNNSSVNRYIQSLTLNGKPLSRHFLYHSEIISGGRLELQMGPEPAKSGND